MAPYGRSNGANRGGGFGGPPSKRGRANGGGSAPAPSAPGPIRNQAHILANYYSAAGPRAKNKPSAQSISKYMDNSKGVISNYITTLGEQVSYRGGKVTVDGTPVFRVTIVADPDPPPPQQAFGAPSLPQMSQPIVGTGDGSTLKEAEKLAALDACLQLYNRGLFTATNQPTRARAPGFVPAQTASASNGKNGGGGGGGGGASAFQQFASTAPGQPIAPNDGKTIGLSNGQRVGLEEARAFMDFYCQRFNFGRPDLQYSQAQSQVSRYSRKSSGGSSWQATLLVGGRRIGMGEAPSKKDATSRAYLDVAQYLESCDPDLWTIWTEKKSSLLVSKGVISAHVVFSIDQRTDEELRETVHESRESSLFKRAKAMIQREKERAETERLKRRYPGMAPTSGDPQEVNASGYTPDQIADMAARRAAARAPALERKSADLTQRLKNYQTEPRLDKMRAQRQSLPVSSHASSVLAKIATSSVVVVLAATGSGKTTQLPQLILDDWILRGDGAKCNIVCTQPRRIAAISVAERVAKERGESIGDSVGYQVRFESKPPKPDGSILFCTTGLFLRRMQTDLNNDGSKESFLDGVTHVCVDEVHERDVDTDLLLFVLRMLLHKRRSEGKAEIRVVLMSATIDPVLFTTYFAHPDSKRPAPVVEVPGRSFPVDKHWLDETVEELRSLRLKPNEGGWVWSEKSVVAYLQRELVPHIGIDPKTGRTIGEIDDLDMPYPLLALIIANVIAKSDEGHVLVFLPGWDEIQAIRNLLIDSRRYPLLGIDFTSRQYEIHLLHSTIPIAEQQAVFEPPPEGIRRIVLSTNIAETSVTIPDVVYVVDSAKCKEKRYDPERRLSQLVSAWTGTSNVLQRAGRAGRHRAGEYYGIVSNARFKAMDIHQTVEMLRTDLANTCMHITGLQLPNLSVEDVLAATIQPPERARVHAAMTSLLMVGAIDRNEKLTSLGRVLLQLPVEAAIGKLCLLGSFFRCLEQTLTLAAIITNRDPFLSPPLMKAEADRVKNSWAPTEFRSDVFAILAAFNAWWKMQSRGDFVAANNFCRENFLSKPTLLMIQKIKEHILQSLDKAGVLRVSGGGNVVSSRPGSTFRRGGSAIIPESLNVNGHSLPLLSALIAAALAPNFAIRISEKALRTSQDKSCTIHPSSVNSKKNVEAADIPIESSKQLYAYGEKSKTGAINDKNGGQMFLRSTTLLDPLGYMLFGAHDIRVTQGGLECDNWLPIVGNVSALDDVERLKDVLDLSLLRVFEGLGVAISKGRAQLAIKPSRTQHDDEENEGEADQEAVDLDDPTLSEQEVAELDSLTAGVVRILNEYADNRGAGSRVGSRPETPAAAAAPGPMRSFASVPATRSGTPRDSPLNSRPASSQGPTSSFGSKGGSGAGGFGGHHSHSGGSGGGGSALRRNNAEAKPGSNWW